MSRATLLVGLLLLGGCNALDKGTRASVSYYTLDGSAPAVAERDARRVGIEDIGGRSQVDGLQMTRRLERGGPVYQLYPEHHRWAALPSDMASDAALQYLRARFSDAEAYPAQREVDAVLRVELTRFEEVRPLGAAGATAMVRLEGRWLVRHDAGVQQLGPHFVVDGEAPIQHPGPDVDDYAAIARGMRAALLDALGKAVGELR